jgi:hypothetical protein
MDGIQLANVPIHRPNLGFLDESVEGANAPSITCRHAIHFVHDDARLVRDDDASIIDLA